MNVKEQPQNAQYVPGWNDPKSPNYNPNLQHSPETLDPANPASRAINPAYGQTRLPERPLNSNPSHQPHECCGRIFQSKEAFDDHFASVHQPFYFDELGKRVDNPDYIAPEAAGAAHSSLGLPMAEHRAGPFSGVGHSTGLAATEKRIPVPASFNNPAADTAAVGQASAADPKCVCGKLKSEHFNRRGDWYCSDTDNTQKFAAAPIVAAPVQPASSTSTATKGASWGTTKSAK